MEEKKEKENLWVKKDKIAQTFYRYFFNRYF